MQVNQIQMNQLTNVFEVFSAFRIAAINVLDTFTIPFQTTNFLFQHSNLFAKTSVLLLCVTQQFIAIGQLSEIERLNCLNLIDDSGYCRL